MHKGILIALIVLVLIIIIVAVNKSKTPSSPVITAWTVYPAKPTETAATAAHMILRKNNGAIECASKDAKNCMYYGNKDQAVAALAALDPTALRPLQCGEPHKLAWGNDGYSESPAHWCNTPM